MNYPNLPGIQVSTVDGALRAVTNPVAKSTVVIGTSGQGPADSIYQVTDPALAGQVFGYGGTLMRAMEEVMANGDNVFLFRMGTVAGTVTGLGKQTGTGAAAGFNVTFNGDRSAATGTDYRVYCRDGILYIFNNQNLVYANDAGVQVVDTGDVQVTGASALATGCPIGTAKTWDGAIPLSSLSAQTSATPGMVQGSVAETFAVVAGVSDKLTLTVNGADLPLITLTAGVARTAAQVAQDINTAASASVLAVAAAGKLNIQTLTTGVSATIQVKAGATTTCATLLGLDTTSHTGLATDAARPSPAFTAAVDGLGMTARQTYVAQQKAMDILTIFPVQQVVVPNCVLDNANVALGNDPTADVNCLDWLSTTTAADGHSVYQWASETKDSDGGTVQAATFSSATDRLTKGFREVNFGYQLARFCSIMSKVQPYDGGTLGFIGCSAPKSFNLVDLRSWVGKSPTLDPVTGLVTASGTGLLGIPCLAGCASATLSLYCVDKSSGRTNGFFENAAMEYDGGASLDANQCPIDIGAYLHVFGDWGYLQNGFGTYTGNGAGMVAGLHSMLDAKSSLLNKPVYTIQQLWHPTLAQLDALTAISVNMFRFDGNGNPPRLTHGKTVADVNSDFILLTRMDIKFLVVQTAANVAKPFIGESTNDGLQMLAMQTALDHAFADLKSRGYIGYYKYTVSSTPAQKRLGNATLNITFTPAMELVKLFVSVGLAPA